jgi:uncharacterized protein
MQDISAEEIIERIRLENPWWEGSHRLAPAYRDLKPRAYFQLFFPLAKRRDVRRAVVLMGPRRVGKTVLLHQTIEGLINEDENPHAICYVSVDHPIYNGLSLEKILSYYAQASGIDYKREEVFVFFDEIQYLRQWEVHLKSLVDSYPNIKAVASGSAAAALRLKTEESGAGRFTDFLLPPLTFHEYLDLLDKTDLIQVTEQNKLNFFSTNNIEGLNDQFIRYLNVGGYPEAIFSAQIQADPARFIKSDIIDKVLLRDLPSLYGISDIQELNYLFTALAFNTAKEVSLEELSKNSGVAKNTIKKYIDYLEAAFLIRIVHRVDRSAKRFRRANFFKVYLANPSMRAALFSPLTADHDAMGALAETAIFSQWFHYEEGHLHYARWADGEVDIVSLNPDNQKAFWAVEVKWSDRICENTSELRNVVGFCRCNKLDQVRVTSRTITMSHLEGGVTLNFCPASIYCYTVGFNIVHSKVRMAETASA